MMSWCLASTDRCRESSMTAGRTSASEWESPRCPCHPDPGYAIPYQNYLSIWDFHTSMDPWESSYGCTQ